MTFETAADIVWIIRFQILQKRNVQTAELLDVHKYFLPMGRNVGRMERGQRHERQNIGVGNTARTNLIYRSSFGTNPRKGRKKFLWIMLRASTQFFSVSTSSWAQQSRFVLGDQTLLDSLEDFFGREVCGWSKEMRKMRKNKAVYTGQQLQKALIFLN